MEEVGTDSEFEVVDGPLETVPNIHPKAEGSVQDCSDAFQQLLATLKNKWSSSNR